MLTAFISFYFGAAFYVAVLAATDPEVAGEWGTVLFSSLLWPYSAYMAVQSGGGQGRG